MINFLENFRDSWLYKQGTEVYSDLIFAIVAVLFMRKISGFDHELSHLKRVASNAS